MTASDVYRGSIMPEDGFRIETECLLGSRTGLLERKTHRNGLRNSDRGLRFLRTAVGHDYREKSVNPRTP